MRGNDESDGGNGGTHEGRSACNILWARVRKYLDNNRSTVIINIATIHCKYANIPQNDTTSANV